MRYTKRTWAYSTDLPFNRAYSAMFAKKFLGNLDPFTLKVSGFQFLLKVSPLNQI